MKKDKKKVKVGMVRGLGQVGSPSAVRLVIAVRLGWAYQSLV